MKALAAAAGDLSIFGQDPFWLVLLKGLVIFLVLVLLTLFTIWFERRVVARMQQRFGPNRWGPFGLLQRRSPTASSSPSRRTSPRRADKLVYLIAPVISAIPAFLAFAVIPVGPDVSIFGVETPLQLTDFPVSVLYILAIASIGIYGIVLAGWSSGSTYPLLGGLRSSAQMISYEIAMGLSFVAVFLYAGSMSTSEIVAKQAETFSLGGLSSTAGSRCCCPSFLIYLIAMVGETNRAPFDLPEAEGELVGGFHTEYSSLKFALFFLAEYINMVTVSALATTLFLGGWAMPVADLHHLAGRQRGLVAGAVVHRQALRDPLRVHLAARHAAAAALRPVHEVRLEGADPRLDRVDPDRCRRSARCANQSDVEHRPLLLWGGLILAVVAVFAFVLDSARRLEGRRRRRDRRSSTRSRAATPCRRCPVRSSS